MINASIYWIEIILICLYAFFVYTERLYLGWPVMPANLIMLPLLMCLLVRLKRNIHEEKIVKSIMFFFFWCILSFLWTQDVNIAIVRCTMIMSLMVLSYLIINRGVCKKELILIEFVIICAGIVTASDLIINGQNFFGNVIASRLSLDDDSDPNYFAMSLIVPFFIAYNLIYKKGWYKLLSMITVGVIGYAVLLLASRGGILAIFCGVVISLFINKKYKVLLFFVVTVAYILSMVAQELERFSFDHIMERGGAGRTNIWMVAVEMIKDNFINGVGLNNFTKRYNEYAAMSSSGFSEGTYRAVHNGYLEIFCELGIVGLIAYFNIFFCAIKKYTRIIIYNYSGLLCGLIGTMIAGGFLSVVASRSVWFILAILIGCCRENEGKI